MTLALEWSKQDEFRRQPLRAWIVDSSDGQATIAGLTRSGGGLTFATIAGAGHMVCTYASVLAVLQCLPADGGELNSGRHRTISRSSRSSWRTGGWRGRRCERIKRTEIVNDACTDRTMLSQICIFVAPIERTTET